MDLSRFTFPGRGDKYSDMKWNFNHFTGVDYDAKTETTAIFKASPISDGISSLIIIYEGADDRFFRSKETESIGPPTLIKRTDLSIISCL